MKTALVVGGTGPTGPHIVNGLLGRGYEVSVLHGGFHEVEFAVPVEHIHTDPHFKETLEVGVDKRKWWDLMIFTYGRLRIGVEVAKGRTGRFIGVGTVDGVARTTDPRWGLLGKPFNVREEFLVPESDMVNAKMGARIAEAREAVFQAHRDGHYNATYIGYPVIYGPRAQAPKDWCIVRRILDGRRRLIIADGGSQVLHRGYAENVAHGLLLAVDRPDAAAGRDFVVKDQRQYNLRQRIETIAKYMGHEWEMVDMPWEFGVPSRPYTPGRDPWVRDTGRIETELGYRDVVPMEAALKKTVDWLLEGRPEPGGEVETQIGDPFDYEKEDQIIDAWERLRGQMQSEMAGIGFEIAPPAHAYRHPKAPGEAWRRPEQVRPME
ncbi:MAG: NAD-dependent dehydratase [Chloroflexi bacterium]|nr:NAD-dependent dehydratase [Chloroflexota bacterium]